MISKLRQVSNPPNPYESVSRSLLEEPPPVEIHVYEERAKSILSQNDSPDLPFTWSLNPYRGCQHACAYCYARPRHEMLGFGAGTDFENKIVAKVNAPELLREQLRRKSWKGEGIAFSGDTDCYQPLEASYQLTRSCLQVCLEEGNPVTVITKSKLVARDAALLASIHEKAQAEVFISIPFMNRELCRGVEPGAPTPQARLESLRKLSSQGLPVGVMLAPVIPGLNDSEIPDILKAAKEAGARVAHYQILRLPGSTTEVFLDRLKHRMPLAYGKIEGRIKASRGGDLNEGRFFDRHRGQGTYWQTVRRLFELWQKKLGYEPGFRRELKETAHQSQGSLFS